MGKRQQDLFDTDPAPWALDDLQEQAIAEVVFAEPPHGPYDYRIPESLRASVQAGVRLRVPLGRGNRKRAGYCVDVRNEMADATRLKDVAAVLDRQVLVSPTMLRLTRWMAEYYLAAWGQVLDAVLPSGVRGQAGTREQLFLSVRPAVAARLTQLKLPRRQAECLATLVTAGRPMTPSELATAVGCTQHPIQGLRRKGLVDEQVRRIQQTDCQLPVVDRQPQLTLSDQQRFALDAVLEPIRAGRHATVLLHGVTGSGKTEVYIQAIDEVIHYGRQAIVLVPEISLTPQTRRRFQSRFDRIAVLHSHLTPAERHWHWRQIAAGRTQVVVGARSAVFAPTPHLGLIVVDEEHDASFKQDKVPRYHAREVALQRARMENVPVVLGTATPSLESWHAAQQGDYRLVEMPDRVSQRPLPDVMTIDLRTRSRGDYWRGAITRQLGQAVREALRSGGQVILLLNRRGFSTTIQCPGCGHVMKCPECDIALTHHRQGEKAVCHYCQYQVAAPHHCPQCRFEGIRYSGRGTQRLEAEVRGAFPQASVLRMDSDSMSRHGAHEAALEKFRKGEVQILLGTQMIAKGLDFPQVTLVGVVNADTCLHFPDFRAAERTFQLVTQVAGRTGRGEQGGRVIVQTYSPDHPAILAAQRHDYRAFAEQELPARREFGYPPMNAMVRLVVRGAEQEAVAAQAEQLGQSFAQRVKQQAGEVQVLGPAEAPIARLRGQFRYHLILHGPDGAVLRGVVQKAVGQVRWRDKVICAIDVDPLDML